MILKGDIITCSSCKRQNKVVSTQPGFLVCPDCGAVYDKDTQALLRTVVSVPEDMSVIRIGSTGKLPDQNLFEVIGRYKIDAEDGYFNLWNILLLSSEKCIWIIDSFGEYVVGGSKPLTFDKVDKDFWKSDCNYRLDLAELGGFTLMAKPKLTGQYLEGEIPEMPEDITACSLYELADEHGKQALLIRGKWDQLIFISGNTLKWEAFHFESTRKETFIGT